MSTPAAIAACRSATSFLAGGNLVAARATIEPALAEAPDDPNLLYVAGNVALAGGDDERALGLYRRAVIAAPQFPAALLNLGYLLRRRHELGEARTILRRCVELVPKDPHGWLNLTATFVNEGEPATGEAVAREGLRHCPMSPDVRWNLGLLLLEQGRWREGWQEYFHRFDTPVLRAPRYGPDGAQPPRLRSPDDLHAGEVVVCHGEQGLGDEILFAGMLEDFLALARRRGAKVLLDCNPRLRGVFARSFDVPLLGDGSAVPRAASTMPIDAVPIDRLVPLGDLGMFFRNEAADFPDRGGYLTVDARRVEILRKRLSRVGRGRPLVGLAWTGGSMRTHARYRHVPLTEWLSLLKQDVCVVSLEYRDRSEEIATLRRNHGIDVVSLPDHTLAEDYERTFELIAALDFVVTVPTSVLHVAGALGKPCLVAMHHRAAWRECSHDGRIAWYPRTHERFVRGPTDDGWGRVIAAIAGRCESMLRFD